MSKTNIVRACDKCGNEDSIDTLTGLCPSCLDENKSLRTTLNNMDKEKEW